MEETLPKRTRIPHERPDWVREDAIFFITVCCEPRGLNQLCHETIASKLFETVEFRQNRGEWYVHLLLLMPDHLHGLISFPTDRSMCKVIYDWKESAARRADIFWQRDFFDHRLRNDEHYIEKANYIRMNPVRKGLAGTSETWPYVWPKKIGTEKTAGQGCPALPQGKVAV